MDMKHPTDYKGEQIPTTFASHIVIKSFGADERGLLAFIKRYKDSRSADFGAGREMIEPTPLMYRAAESRKAGLSQSEIAHKLGMSKPEVSQAVDRVAKWVYLKG